MNLRLFVFLALGALSTTTSASWFGDYQVKASSEASQTVVTVAQSYPDTSDLLINHDTTPTMILAPSFDVVAREMEQMKENQVSQDYVLITYLQKNNTNF